MVETLRGSLTYSTFVFAYWQFLGDIYETNHELQMISPIISSCVSHTSRDIFMSPNGNFSCYIHGGIFFIMNENHKKFA